MPKTRVIFPMPNTINCEISIGFQLKTEMIDPVFQIIVNVY